MKPSTQVTNTVSCSRLRRRICLAAMAFSVVLFSGSITNQAEAAPPPGTWVQEHHVQVEYWFFDTDYYYWSTVYSSTNQQVANFVYAVSEMAMDNGTLNQLWPNDYWRYFAVDVRLITTWKYIPAQRLSVLPIRLP